MGETEISPNDFMNYLKSIELAYSASKYHIFENNCNHFANNICEFLVGKPIPEWIIG